MAIRTASAPSLPTALFGFVCLTGLLTAATTGFLFFDRARAFETRALEQAVAVRGVSAANEFARSLDALWRTLQAIKTDATAGDDPGLRGALAAVVADGHQVSWAGFAGTDGIVRAASDGLLEGADVSTRPWFQRGLVGDFAGDVHEAVLLNRLLGGTQENPFRFIDLSASVTAPNGQVLGVLGFHIDFAWAEGYLSDMARQLELDLYLVDQSGKVILATAPLGGEVTQLLAFQAAASGVSASMAEVWPDGVTYHASVIPEVRYGDLPSFGWRLIARIAPTAFDAARGELQRGALTIALSAFAVLLFLSVLFSLWFLRPVRLLAENAHRISEGADEYPAEYQRTSELAMLSAALARLESRADPVGRAADKCPGKK